MPEGAGEDALTPETTNVAGFWRRCLAFFLDSVVIGLPAFLAGLLLFDQFAALGSWGRLVGFLIALIYFGVGNSAVTGGQTIGKKCVRIRVVTAIDQPISLPRSIFRYTIIGLPYFLNGAPFLQRAPTWIVTGAAVILFGFGGAIIYLLIFNRRNRRSLHDLLAGTHVMRCDRAASSPPRPTWKGHFVIMAVAGLLMSGLVAVAYSFIKPETFGNLLNVQRALLDQPDVTTASVMQGTRFFAGFGGERSSTTYLDIAVRVRSRPEDDAARADELIATTLRVFPEAQQTMRLNITIDYGYDLGIASGSVKQSFDFTPAEWQERLRARATSPSA